MLQQRGTPRKQNTDCNNNNMSSESDHKAELNWMKQEEENVQLNRQNQLRAQLREEMYPSRYFLHRCFILVSAVVGITAFLMGLGQFIGIVYLHVGIIQYILRVYVIIMCVLSVFNELEWTFMTRDSAVLKYWISRGFYYGFIGLLGLEENNVTPTSETSSSSFGRSAALRFLNVVAWMMVGCGMLYLVMGLFCLQLVSNRLRQDYTQRLERAKETRRLQETYGNVGPVNPV